MDYRREIDGLRAIAVISVVLYHAGIQAFSGGFIGVDVFFVISGYLITSIILAEMQAGTFTLGNFYERRARRILPALFVLMFTCLPFAWLWLSPRYMKDFSESLVAVPAFASNVLFFITSGYFDAATEIKPLSHTWSLAVEEQYYILFPAFLMLTQIQVASGSRKRWIVAMLTALAIVSLAVAEWASLMYPRFTFYLLPARGWEILIGVFVAVFQCARYGTKIKVEKSVSLIGLALIACAVFSFDSETPSPSLYTLMPTIGAALIILFATQQTLVGKLLGCKMLVGIGLISYSIYLWHQPIFAFARQFSIDEPSKFMFLALAVIAVVFAYLSWKYVEAPFRNVRCFDRKQVFLCAAIGSVFFVALGLFGYANKGFKNQIDAATLKLFEPESTGVGKCLISDVDGKKDITVCYFGDTDAEFTIALYGDSHAEALFSELDSSFKRSKIRGVKVSFQTACKTWIPGIIIEGREMEGRYGQCASSFDKFLDYLSENVHGVIVSLRWTSEIYPIKGVVDESYFDNREGGVELDRHVARYVARNHDGAFTYDANAKMESLRGLLGALNLLRKPVFLIYPIPEVGWHVPNTLYKKYMRGESLSISTSHERFKSRNYFINEVFDSATEGNLVRVKPEEILCDTYVRDRCVATLNGAALYYDDDHLSNAGARLVVDEIMAYMSNGRKLVRPAPIETARKETFLAQ